jgi:uncharacterized protein
MKMNPIKFGSVVKEQYFSRRDGFPTNRLTEIRLVKSILASKNHLIIISPRRFGKTSLISKVINEIGRPYVLLDLQLVTNIEDFAARLLKRIYRIYPVKYSDKKQSQNIM